MDIQCFLDKANTTFDPFIFESGQCHTFALAFKKRFGGKLLALMRRDAEDGLEWYSHMIVLLDNECFDIHGKDADESWCENFPEDDEFDDILIEEDGLDDFLANFDCSINKNILDQLLNL